MRILGIDPGIRNTGWGVISSDGGHLRHIANGVIRPDPGAADAARLKSIADGLDDVLAMHAPDLAAIEEIFVARSPASALKLGMARGVAMMVCGQHGLDVREIAARLVKKTVTGTGTADKTQITLMIERLLGVRPASADAADALAIAIAGGNDAGNLATSGVALGAGRPAPSGGTSNLSEAIEAALARDHRLEQQRGGQNEDDQ